jgi:hypothetical protein
MRLAILLVVVACCAGTAYGRDGRLIYEANCASCHGLDGRGETAREALLPVQPPDFTDCKFGTPEPNSDWLATTHEGGLARGFDRLMPAFGEVLGDDEIVDVVQYLRTFCKDPVWPRGEFNLARAFFVEKAFPEDEAVIAVAGFRSDVVWTFFYERRIGRRWQIELTAPVVYSEQMAGGWAGGIGDLAFSLERVLVANLDTGSIVSASVEVLTPTGDVAKGFGGGTTRFEGALLAAQLFPHGAFVQLQGGAGVAYDRQYPDEVFGRAALGDQIVPIRFGRMFTPMVEITAARELEMGAETEVHIVPELQVTLSARQHIRVLAGLDVPVTQRDTRDVTVLFYALWDIADGGLLEGW